MTLNKTQRYALLFSLAATQAFAQVGSAPTYTGTVNPQSVMWIVVTIVGGMVTAIAACALLWTAAQGMLSDHDHFGKLPKLFFWGAIAAGATGMAYRMAAGA